MRKRIFGSIWFAGLVCYVAAGCQSAPERDFTEVDLLIGLDAMPGRWEVMEIIDDGGYPPYEGADSYAAVYFKALNPDVRAVSYVGIYRNRNESRAAKFYQKVSQIYGYSCGDNQIPNHISVWPMPEEFTFAPAVADQWCFGCGIMRLTEDRYCKYQARYEEFFVDFSIPLEVGSEQHLTIPEVETIVRAIDERMGEKLR